MSIEMFANDRYKVLKLLSESELSIRGNLYVSLSQQEIADLAHFSKMKINKILNELIKEGYVILHNNKRGKYSVTDKGYLVLDLFQNKNI
ncbi:winged helix-turn-helix transcriptional regulator [Clostridium perfringens]